MAPYSSALHSGRNPFVMLRKIVLGRKARSDTLFVVGTSRSLRNTSNCPAPTGTAGAAGDCPPAPAPRPATHPTATASPAAAAPASDPAPAPASAQAGRPAAEKQPHGREETAHGFCSWATSAAWQCRQVDKWASTVRSGSGCNGRPWPGCPFQQRRRFFLRFALPLGPWPVSPVPPPAPSVARFGSWPPATQPACSSRPSR